LRTGIVFMPHAVERESNALAHAPQVRVENLFFLPNMGAKGLGKFFCRSPSAVLPSYGDLAPGVNT